MIKKEFLECKKNIYVISICLALLINSFFHLFFIFFILTSFCIAYKFIKDDSQSPVAKIQIIVASSFIVLIGIIIFFTQQYFSENDYANRIGVHYLTLNDRIQSSLEFLKILKVSMFWESLEFLNFGKFVFFVFLIFLYLYIYWKIFGKQIITLIIYNHFY